MCQLCHGTDVAGTVKEYTNTLANPEFNKWNTTSVNHILISLSGQDGHEARQLALQLMENFLEWHKMAGANLIAPEQIKEYEVLISTTKGLLSNGELVSKLVQNNKCCLIQ